MIENRELVIVLGLIVVVLCCLASYLLFLLLEFLDSGRQLHYTLLERLHEQDFEREYHAKD